MPMLDIPLKHHANAAMTVLGRVLHRKMVVMIDQQRHGNVLFLAYACITDHSAAQSVQASADSKQLV